MDTWGYDLKRENDLGEGSSVIPCSSRRPLEKLVKALRTEFPIDLRSRNGDNYRDEREKFTRVTHAANWKPWNPDFSLFFSFFFFDRGDYSIQFGGKSRASLMSGTISAVYPISD